MTELFIRGRKPNISLIFITQFYFAVPNNTRLNSRLHFIKEISNKQELKQIAFNHSPDIQFKDFMSFSKPYSFSFIDGTVG